MATQPDSGPVVSARPTGTVTFLFTDIEGSTQRWESHREAMDDAVKRHDALFREAVDRHNGYVFKAIGDAFCVAFARVSDAVTAACEAQQALSAEDFSAVGGLPVRMGLHAGEASERNGDYFGPAVNRVARLMSIGHGGQILASGAIRGSELDFDELPKGSTTFSSIALTLPKHPFGPGGLQWYGKYLAVSAFDGNVVYQYSVHGNKATRVHSTPLDGVRPKYGVIDFRIQNTTLVAPIISLSVHHDPFGTIELFKYPEGGKPSESISKSVAFPIAAAVSPAE
jgi:hypothetical protein